jgi:sulfite reductase (NADPH) hemoprotein beta-component
MDRIEPQPAADHGAAGLYRYGDYDRAFLQARIAEFRDQAARRLAGDLTEDEFKPLRLMNGLYLQLHAYMLRVAIPYGVLSATQMRRLADIAQRWDRGYGHFTTRQNIQFNWVRLEETADILAALAEVDMHAIQTSGNCIRNVTTDEFAGVATDEIVDPRVYAETLRQWSTAHPEFSFLPRKFKIAITGAEHDRAAVQVHDIGLLARRDAAGAVGFRVYVGGGLGRVPIIGFALRDFVPEADLIAYLEAILRVYNAHGGRENIHKARIKILVRDLGQDRFRELVEEEFAAIPRGTYTLTPETVAAIRARFATPPLVPDVQAAQPAEAALRTWMDRNVQPHRVPGHVSVVISLKPPGGIPGDATAAQMEAVADLAERYSHGEIRVTHSQNLVLPHVRNRDLAAVHAALTSHELATANIGLVGDIIACPGLDYCALANARSIPIAQRISDRFAEVAAQVELGPVTLNISGCINACAHHHVGNIGILGVEKHGEEAYQVTLGGRSDDRAAIGRLLGPSFTAEQVVDAVETVLQTYLRLREPSEAFVDAVDRLGLGPFKEAVYAHA